MPDNPQTNSDVLRNVFCTLFRQNSASFLLASLTVFHAEGEMVYEEELEIRCGEREGRGGEGGGKRE